jgi:hypothetical protein
MRRQECCVEAVEVYMARSSSGGTDLSENSCDFFTFLRKNHRITDLYGVIQTLCSTEGRYALLTWAHYWSVLMARRIPIYHIFVMKARHVYNIRIDGAAAATLIDTANRREEELQMDGLLREMCSADMAIFVLPAWAEKVASHAALKLSE